MESLLEGSQSGGPLAGKNSGKERWRLLTIVGVTNVNYGELG